MNTMRKMLSTLFVFGAACVAVSVSRAETVNEFREHVSAMKQAPRGPFARLRWFCADGQVLPPKPYACRGHGGGVQHGEYSERTREIRAAGYPIATLLADLEPHDIVGTDDGAQLLEFLLLEQFLVDFDDGWIFRKARFYRGAIQHEDEQRSGQAILEALVADEDWLRDRFVVVREAVRLLPHDRSLVSLGEVRGLAAAIADKDPGFRALRGKIHGRPDADDADRVRDYADTQGVAKLRDDYAKLATLIDAAYRGRPLATVIGTATQATTSPQLRRILARLKNAPVNGPADELALAATGMKLIRDRLTEEGEASARVGLLDASLELERIAFIAARALETGKTIEVPRRDMLVWLRHNADALYGAGLVTGPEHREVLLSLEQIDDEPLRLARYRRELRRLGMASAWASRQLGFHFADSIERLGRIEPLAEQFIADRLRGSPLLAFESTHAALSLDAQSVSAVSHELFGEPVAAGLRSLNPGLARGTLYIADHDTPLSDFDAHGIYIVPETLPKLPPVAGIVTRSEGNALSHVQLLARNLGIPNVVVSDALLDRLEPHVGARIVMAASTGGVVRIAEDSFHWDNVFRAGADRERAPLRIDVDALDLDKTSIVSLTDLRATDSGRIVGPKAAKLGELMHRFPGRVAPGVALPFGLYRELLSQPVSAADATPMIDWLTERYRALAVLKTEDVAAYEQSLEKTLAFVRDWFAEVPLPEGFRDELRETMRNTFGTDDDYGVFVRSDTNVEDLPNFSGAGLNLTVPNVVGLDATIDAIRRVWASPFTTRAFAWRQSLMDRPEHVYASVLLQRGVPAAKSGVLVTSDIESGSRDRVTVVVNEGVGGGVNGQLAETLTIDIDTGATRRISTATATERMVLARDGGVATEPVENSEMVLDDDEIAALCRLATEIPERLDEFSAVKNADPPAADVEFGFVDGQLWLFQVRPFVESGAANRNRYLNALDAGLRRSAGRLVDLDRAVTLGAS